MLVVGLMSGTSADAVDASLVRIERRGGASRMTLLAFVSQPYSPALQQRIVELSLSGGVAEICHMNMYLGELFARAALRVIRKAGRRPNEIDLIGSHGQTIHHLPQGIRESGVGVVRSTLQIGEPAVIAERTGVTTIANFRPRDMVVGGEGAPLVPYAHAIAFGRPRRGRLVVNIGGISNVTYVPPGGDPSALRAFDTGPGNMVSDAIVRALTHERQAFDADGRRAQRGTVHPRILTRLRRHPFLSRRPPKSTGREAFGAPFVQRLLQEQRRAKITGDDLLATCARWTAEAIGTARNWIPNDVADVVVGGGGVRNRAILAQLREVWAPIPVKTFDACGWSSQAFESTAFALLAYETYHGRCTNVPQVTGAARAVVLGSITPGHLNKKPRAGRRSPEAAR